MTDEQQSAEVRSLLQQSSGLLRRADDPTRLPDLSLIRAVATRWKRLSTPGGAAHPTDQWPNSWRVGIADLVADQPLRLSVDSFAPVWGEEEHFSLVVYDAPDEAARAERDRTRPAMSPVQRPPALANAIARICAAARLEGTAGLARQPRSYASDERLVVVWIRLVADEVDLTFSCCTQNPQSLLITTTAMEGVQVRQASGHLTTVRL